MDLLFRESIGSTCMVWKYKDPTPQASPPADSILPMQIMSSSFHHFTETVQASSLDLNPIEQLLVLIRRDINRRPLAHTKEDRLITVEVTRQLLLQAIINLPIERMTQRIEALIPVLDARPPSSNEDKIAQVKTVVRYDHRLTVREIAQECHISVGSCDEILRKDLNMRRVSANEIALGLREIEKNAQFCVRVKKRTEVVFPPFYPCPRIVAMVRKKRAEEKKEAGTPVTCVISVKKLDDCPPSVGFLFSQTRNIYQSLYELQFRMPKSGQVQTGKEFREKKNNEKLAGGPVEKVTKKQKRNANSSSATAKSLLMPSLRDGNAI
ncbi:hypothetical protein TNCV_520261 [Trichonephila clavipes]|nr:hypothetical protein TNCV_520261 [Trichonephila clavipes]